MTNKQLARRAEGAKAQLNKALSALALSDPELEEAIDGLDQPLNEAYERIEEAMRLIDSFLGEKNRG